jgi:hypothetical protein
MGSSYPGSHQLSVVKIICRKELMEKIKKYKRITYIKGIVGIQG